MEKPAVLLSLEDKQQYEEDGYIVIERLVDIDTIDRFLDYELQPKPEGWRQNLLHHVDDPEWKRLATYPAIVSCVKQLIGAQPSVVQSMFLEKKPSTGNDPGGAGVALHQDLHYLPCEPESLMACWVALNDTDPENGGLSVVPGSHKHGLYSTHKNINLDEHDSWEIEYLMRDQSGKEWKEKMHSFEIDGIEDMIVAHLTVPKGGAVFFDGKTIHGSYANYSTTRYRRAFAVHFVAEDSWVFRADVQQTMTI